MSEYADLFDNKIVNLIARRVLALHQVPAHLATLLGNFLRHLLANVLVITMTMVL